MQHPSRQCGGYCLLPSRDRFHQLTITGAHWNSAAKGRPDVAVVGFDFDGTYFYVSGRNNEKTWKYKNTKANPRASLVLDDLPSIKPWRPRGIKVSGSVDFVHYAGKSSGEREYLRIKPERKYSWGL